jgi:AraC-like DNA-binding protein
MARFDGPINTMRSTIDGRSAGRFPQGAPVLPADAFLARVPEDAVTDLVVRFAADHGVSVPEGFGHGDRMADAWAALSSAGVTHPGLAFAAWATRTLLGGVFPTILANSPDVAGLLDRLQHFHPLFGPHRVMLASQHNSMSVWLEATDGAPAHPETIDAFFAMLCSLTQQLTADRATASQVALRRPPPPDADRYRELLGNVRFGAEHDRCTFDARNIRVPVDHADPAVLSALEPYAERRIAEQGKAFTSRVAQLIRVQLDDIPPLASVSRALALSPRALQLRLADEGTTYSAIVDRVQRERALALLATSDLPITTIATRVGFSAPAALTRAVRRWTGLSPTQYRRGH